MTDWQVKGGAFGGARYIEASCPICHHGCRIAPVTIPTFIKLADDSDYMVPKRAPGVFVHCGGKREVPPEDVWQQAAPGVSA